VFNLGLTFAIVAYGTTREVELPFRVYPKQTNKSTWIKQPIRGLLQLLPDQLTWWT